MTTTTPPAAPALSRIFEPFTIGPMQLRNRIMLPPHASAIGNLFGTVEEAEKHVGYWVSRARAGAAWVGGITGFVENLIPPGFDPSGVGARTAGIWRRPDCLERVGMYASGLHAAGAAATAQLVIQGGMPHGPSQALSGPLVNLVPHALTRDEIRWFVKEYGFSARQAQRAGLDGVEIHANHDDMIEWFLSPKTNRRDDDYGGSFDNRMRFLREIIAEIREQVGADFVVGVRMNMVEGEPGGYDQAGGLAIAQALQDAGRVSYLHFVMGSPWGNPSYIQPHYYQPAQWAGLSQALRKHLTLPIVHTGRVNSPAVAEAVIAAGMADVVGMARAHIAEREIVSKARAGRAADIRPCIGCNECIARQYMEAIPFACTVNPSVGYEIPGLPALDGPPRKLLVVGGGPAGMELAATARERGHTVELWERDSELGGQMALAARMPTQEVFNDYIGHQQRRLESLGVTVRTGKEANAADVLAAGADAVAIATGARARRPDIPGVDGPLVHDAWQILRGEATPGKRVVIIAQDDHVVPLSLADYLSSRGHGVTLVYSTNAPAVLLSRYFLGGILARLSQAGVEIVAMEEVVAIGLPTLTTRNIYSLIERQRGDFDSVALACGGLSVNSLYAELQGKVPALHILGDAYAPRRTVFATRQAYQLARVL